MTKQNRRRKLFRKEGTSRELTAEELIEVSTKPSKNNGRGLGRLQHAAHALRRRYFAGLLDGRSKIGAWTRELERDFSEHLGYESIDEMPPTMAMMVRSTIGNWLLLSTHHAGQERHMFDLRAAENTVLRNCKELGIKPMKRPGVKLNKFLEAEGFEANE